MEHGEQTTENNIVVLLDWEKAFDKVAHEALFNALERVGMPFKIIENINFVIISL